MLVSYTNEEALAFAAAKIFVEQFHIAINRNGRFSVLLSGGNTPRQVYEYLAERPFKDQVDWSQVNIFWGDERCVKSNDPRSNYLLASKALLSHVPIPAQQVHPINCAHDPYISAIRYEHLLREYFGTSAPCFDLIFLGLGVDGHTASLFPQTKVLEEKEHWVVPVQKEDENFGRITLTLPIINLGKMIVFLVAGDKKSEILKKVLSPAEHSTLLPAQQIQPLNGKLLYLADESAIRDLLSCNFNGFSSFLNC